MDRLKEESAQAILPKAVAAHPGYVRLVLLPQRAQARSACRRFSELCREESTKRGLILARSSNSDPVELKDQISLATLAVSQGFKLAVVAQGTDAAYISRLATSSASRRSARAKVFSSEHQAAAWLMS